MARDVDRAVAARHAEMSCQNGMKGGDVQAQEAVSDYWTRQWRLIDPRVEPRRFGTDETGRIVVDVHQVIRDRSGNTVADQMVQHVSTIRDGLIRHMEIRK